MTLQSHIQRLLPPLLLLTVSGGAIAGSVTLDGTTTPDGLPAVLEGPNFQLDQTQGLRRGDNLFHSLGDLVVDEGERLFLTGSPRIDNVLLRITGGEPAFINGQLALRIADANLFMLNPAGVIFGERASVSVPGTLVVSTGTQVPLADGSAFAASGPLVQLSEAPPAAWHRYGAPISGDIEVAATLRVDGGAFLLADRIKFNRGALVAGSNPFETQPRQRRDVSAPGALWMLANTSIEGQGLAAPNLGVFNSFNWSERAAGDIRLSAPLIRFDAASGQSASFGAGAGADIFLNAREHLVLGGRVMLDTEGGASVERTAAIGTGASGTGAGGDIEIVAGRLTLSDRAAIIATSRGAGTGGNQRLVIGEGGLQLGAQTLNASYVRPTAERGAASGDGGNITIDVNGNVLLRGLEPEDAPLSGFNMGIVTKSLTSARAGNIVLRAHAVDLFDGARIESGALGSGRTGDVTVEASDRVTVSGRGRLFNSLIGALASDAGSVGNTTIIAPDINVLNGASVRADSLGSGDAGALTLRADRLRVAGAGTPVDDALFNQWIVDVSRGLADPTTEGESDVRLLQFQLGGVEATVASDALDGPGGDLVIEVGSLEIGDGGRISASSLRDADGGDISVIADQVLLRGDAGVVTDAGRFVADGATASGNAGQISITARDSIQVSNGRITSNSLGGGDAGTITLRAERIELTGTEADISTVSGGTGNAGNINLLGANVRIVGAQVSAEARAAGSGGNLQVDASDGLAVVDASLSASSGAAGGGSLQVNFGAQAPAVISNSVLSADTETGDDQAGSIVLAGDLEGDQLSSVVLNNAQLLANADSGSAGNVLVQAGTVIRDSQTQLTASNRAGLSGPVQIDEQSPNTQIDAAAEPPAPIDPAAQIAACRNDTSGSLWVNVEPAPESPATVLLALASQPPPGRVARSTEPTNDAALYLASTRSALAHNDLGVAERSAQRAIKLSKNPVTLATKAVVDYARADYLQAARAYEETIRLVAGDPARAGTEARARANAARAWLLAGRDEPALEQLRRGQDRATQLPADAERALIMLHLGQTWMSAAQLAQARPGWLRLSALTALRDAHATSRSLDQRADLMAWSLGALSELYAMDGRADDALSLAWQALDVGEHTPDAYRWYRQAGRLLRERGDLEHATALYARALELTSRAGSGVASSQTREAHFRRQIAPVFLEYAALLMAKAESALAGGERQALLFEAREAINRLHAAEIHDYLQDDCAPSPSADSRAVRLAEGVAVVFPIVFEDRVEVLLQTSDGIRQLRSTPLPRVALEARVRELRRRLSDPSRDGIARHAASLYSELFPDLSHALASQRIQRLIVVPDGPLRLIPFGAFHDGDRWLAERFVVEVMQRLAPAQTEPQRANATSARALLAGVSRFQGVDREALRYVPAELASIRSRWPGPTRTLAEESFTKHAFVDSLNGLEPAVVHIATHGTFAGSLEQSFLLTGDGERLEMEALFAPLEALALRQRPVDLVVLSACETALGGERSAIGLAGVALRAGAAHAAGALWPVPDDGTARLFEAFYTELTAERSSDPGRALAVAQRELIDTPRYAHPAYWSGFQVISNTVATPSRHTSATLAALQQGTP